MCLMFSTWHGVCVSVCVFSQGFSSTVIYLVVTGCCLYSIAVSHPAANVSGLRFLVPRNDGELELIKQWYSPHLHSLKLTYLLKRGNFEDAFPFPKVGYGLVPLECMACCCHSTESKNGDILRHVAFQPVLFQYGFLQKVCWHIGWLAKLFPPPLMKHIESRWTHAQTQGQRPWWYDILFVHVYIYNIIINIFLFVHIHLMHMIHMYSNIFLKPSHHLPFFQWKPHPGLSGNLPTGLGHLVRSYHMRWCDMRWSSEALKRCG